MRLLATLVLVASSAVSLFGQYTSEKAGAPPSDVPAALSGVLQKEGVRIKQGDKVYAEVWFREALPSGPKTAEDNVTLVNVPHGSLLGVIRFPANGSDRRGNKINPGTYTLRFSMFPQNGDHQGVAPQRDFLLLTTAANDTDPNATPSFKALTEQSMKSMGIPHPGVFSIWHGEADAKPGFSQEGEHDWVLRTKIGETPFAMILIGKAEG
jgi:hypothetical protein